MKLNFTPITDWQSEALEQNFSILFFRNSIISYFLDNNCCCKKFLNVRFCVVLVRKLNL